jgi:hypothetical protein
VDRPSGRGGIAQTVRAASKARDTDERHRGMWRRLGPASRTRHDMCVFGLGARVTVEERLPEAASQKLRRADGHTSVVE